MIRIWHDDAFRWMPLWLTITMLNTSVLLGAVLFRAARPAGDGKLPSASTLLAILWLAIAFFIVFGHVRTRCQQLELTLPIATRALWRRHLAAVFVAGSVVLAGSVGVLAVHATLLSRVGRQETFAVPYGALVPPLLGGLLLATSLISNVEPGLWKLTGRRNYWLWVLACLLAIPLLLLALSRWPWISTAICVGLALAIGLRTELHLPKAFRIAPMDAAITAPRDLSTARLDRPVGRLQILRTLFNLLHTSPPWKQFTPWMVYSFVALMGFVLAGGLDRWRDVSDLRFLYLPFGSYMLFAGIGVITYNLYRIDSIPVSRRTILAVLTLPGLFFYCVGYAAGWRARTAVLDSQPLVTYNVEQARVEIDLHAGSDAQAREISHMVWVDVDQSFLGVSLSGEVPTLRTAAGESHTAWSEPLLRGLAPVVYNPYNTSEETTADFEASMLSRAIEDVYGQVIPPDELRRRYFVVEDGRVVGLQQLRMIDGEPRHPRSRIDTDEVFALLDDYPHLVRPALGPETPIYMVLVLVPWLVLTALFFRSLKATHSLKYVRRVYWIGLAIPMVAMLTLVLLSVFGILSPDAARAYLAAAIRSLGATPWLWLATWTSSLLIIGLSYWLALRQFERAEIPVSPINCSMVDWGKVD
jgi:hypothetical protein